MRKKQGLSRCRGRGFTLIEIMIVVAIIVILAGISVAVGVQLKAGAYKKNTLSTMKILEGKMRNYLSGGGGNPEPVPSGTIDTNPASDPVNWVRALDATNNLPSSLTFGTLGTNKTVLDGWGTPIRYVPYNTVTKQEGYFVSAGPDRIFFNMTPTPNPAPKQDDVYSFDAP